MPSNQHNPAKLPRLPQTSLFKTNICGIVPTHISDFYVLSTSSYSLLVKIYRLFSKYLQICVNVSEFAIYTRLLEAILPFNAFRFLPNHRECYRSCEAPCSCVSAPQLGAILVPWATHLLDMTAFFERITTVLPIIEYISMILLNSEFRPIALCSFWFCFA